MDHHTAQIQESNRRQSPEMPRLVMNAKCLAVFALLLAVPPVSAFPFLEPNSPGLPELALPVEALPPFVELPDEPATLDVEGLPLDEIVNLTLQYIQNFDPNDNLNVQLNKTAAFIGALEKTIKSPYGCLHFKPGPIVVRGVELSGYEVRFSVAGAGFDPNSALGIGAGTWYGAFGVNASC